VETAEFQFVFVIIPYTILFKCSYYTYKVFDNVGGKVKLWNAQTSQLRWTNHCNFQFMDRWITYTYGDRQQLRRHNKVNIFMTSVDPITDRRHKHSRQ